MDECKTLFSWREERRKKYIDETVKEALNRIHTEEEIKEFERITNDFVEMMRENIISAKDLEFIDDPNDPKQQNDPRDIEEFIESSKRVHQRMR